MFCGDQHHGGVLSADLRSAALDALRNSMRDPTTCSGFLKTQVSTVRAHLCSRKSQCRVPQLPDHVDPEHVEAKLDNGELTVKVRTFCCVPLCRPLFLKWMAAPPLAVLIARFLPRSTLHDMLSALLAVWSSNPEVAPRPCRCPRWTSRRRPVASSPFSRLPIATGALEAQ